MNGTNQEAAIFTERLILEPILAGHAGKLYESLQDSSLYTYIPQDPPSSVDTLRVKYRRWSTRGSDDGTEIWLNYALFHKSKRSYVGTIQATVKDDASAYVAYEVFSDFRRQGIASEACAALIRILLETYSTKKILAHVDTRNEPSWRFLESIGFIFDHKLPEADTFKGSISDEYVYVFDSASTLISSDVEY